MIPLTKPPNFSTELDYVSEVLKNRRLNGQGQYTKRCEAWLEKQMGNHGGKAFLTTSGTSALEMAAMIADIQPQDEIIVSSYTFVSTVNAFVLRGATPVFVDIEDHTMNMDANKILSALTKKTKAIVPVHYAGISCNMDTIMSLAEKYGLMVIEDAAQGLLATYHGRSLGSIGHISCFSFHETKNLTSGGQGGAVLVNRPELISRAEVIHDHGTNRAQFLKGKVEQYEWYDIGSNFVLSEVLAALLWAQFERAQDISNKRHELWSNYAHALAPLAKSRKISLPTIPEGCKHNAHMFYIKLTDPTQRKALISHMKKLGVGMMPHYLPLHSTQIGKHKSRFCGEDKHTSLASSQLLRLPLYFELETESQQEVLNALISFWG